ncbi:Luc7-like protein 3 [Quaeritorhiza haematococci]|nr:Luc7-like protein 3 [Quaeritorhiza haematococci]
MAYLEVKIKDKLQEIETAGEDGRVQEAQNLMTEVEELQAELAALKKVDDTNPLLKLEKRMEVCEVCGAFLVMNDCTQRLDAHLDGKQHKGFLLIRQTLEDMKVSTIFTLG